MRKKIPELYFFYFLLAFVSISGLWGGAGLMIAPDGSFFHLPLEFIEQTIFPDYFIPGICLFLFIGILPALAFWGSIYRFEPKFLERLNVYKDRFWSWTFSFYASIGLLIWINIQIIIIGYHSFIQGFYALVGILMLIVVSLPGVVNHYHK